MRNNIKTSQFNFNTYNMKIVDKTRKIFNGLFHRMRFSSLTLFTKHVITTTANNQMATRVASCDLRPCERGNGCDSLIQRKQPITRK